MTFWQKVGIATLSYAKWVFGTMLVGLIVFIAYFMTAR